MCKNREEDKKRTMKNNDIVSVVIATFNSEDKLPRTLKALRNQTYPSSKMEILVIDGGSTDATKEIANSFGCKVIYNEKVEPVYAKLLGVRNAKGKYLLTLDHDEVLTNPRSIEIRVKALKDNPECKAALLSGYRRPDHYPLLNQYISEFGDPFSFFIYRFSKDCHFFIKKLKQSRGECLERQEYWLKSFEKAGTTPIFELCCLATIIDLEWFKQNTKIAKSSKEMVHLFYIMLDKGCNSIVVSKNDELLHYSVDSLKAYFPKLKWRICNNIHHKANGENGFNGRAMYQKNVRYKKYFFVPYTISCVFPIIDSIYLAITRKNPVYLIHLFLCWYVLVQIVYQYFLKLLHKTPRLKSYDGKKNL